MRSLLYLSLVALCFASLETRASDTTPAAGAPNTAAMPGSGGDAQPAPSAFTIAGPLRSFLRMAGISQRVAPEEVVPLLSRNIFTQGYEGNSRQTEFLILLSRYVEQSRELAVLAGNTGMVIRVSNCEDAKPLLMILGYRAKPGCGTPDTSLQTSDAERAFLTIDSGFPLPELERTLQGGKPFEYAYTGSAVPLISAESDWTLASKKNYKENSRDLVRTLLTNPTMARLYWALSKLDPSTSAFLLQSVGVSKLVPYAAVLDFYGTRITIREGRVVVPGGPNSESTWKDLVGAPPANPSAFIQKLIAKDKGWLCAYFDVLSRTNQAQQAYFTDSRRLKSFYDGLRAIDAAASATTGSFRPAPELLLLVTRLQIEPNGQPLVPGNLAVWKEILKQKNNPRNVRGLGKKTNLDSPDDLVRAMIAFSHVPENGPVPLFMGISELDARRPPERRLAPETVRLLASKYEDYSDQYRVFSEFPQLSDASMRLFFDTAAELSETPSPIRGNALGTFQANIGIWQILARQGQIPAGQLDDSWQGVIKPFAKIHAAAQVYDAGRASLGEVFRFATGKPRPSQDEIIELLAGPAQTTPEGKRMHQELASRMRSALDGQRLVSLDTVLSLGDALNDKAQGKPTPDYVFHLAGELREFEMPRPIFTAGERTEWAAGIYNNHHTDQEMKTDLGRVLRSTSPSRSQLDEARGQLSPFLRDTLVGLNYAYYEPPGAQALHENPLFVRSHDFAAETISGIKTVWQAPQLIGQGSPAGGGAHFVGSLADLPYALADLEQDFISPESVQALIWKELTPGLMTSAILPRWWNVSPDELHAVALYQRSGEEILTAAAKDDQLRGKVMSILSERIIPQQSGELDRALHNGQIANVLPHMTPADTFYLTAEFQRRYPGEIGTWGAASQELQSLSKQHPDQVDWKRLSRDFGVPHPSLAQTYSSELLNVAPMPAFSGTSSRFLAESWDSTNLYWARLADEKGVAPVTLNHLVPELTRHMVEKIFATDFEDWPALLRAMHETGDDFRQGKLDVASAPGSAQP